MRCRVPYFFRPVSRRGSSGWVVLLALFLLPFLQGCAQGELELLVNDIKRFYLNGGFHAGGSSSSAVEQKAAMTTSMEDLIVDRIIDNLTQPDPVASSPDSSRYPEGAPGEGLEAPQAE